MTKCRYYMHELIEKYYKRWINSPTLIEHITDRKVFYSFVKACIRYSKHRRAKQDIHGSWLRYFFERDLSGHYNEQYLDEIVHKIVVLFDHILEFNEVSCHDPLVEMKNPLSVYSVLRRYNYSEDKIEKILTENFGASWRKKWSILWK